MNHSSNNFIENFTKVNIAPKAKKIPYQYEVEGQNINDDYHWLRDANWPKVENKNIIHYLEQENAYADKFFDHLKPLQETLYQELKSRIKEDDSSYPTKVDEYYYYSRVENGQNYAINCRKKASLENNEEIILDANLLAKDHKAFSMSAFSVNPSHDLLAYSTDLTGEEKYTIYIKNLKDGSLLQDIIKATIGNIVWHRSDNGFFYQKLDDKHRSTKIYYHKLGTTQDKDQLIFHEQDATFSVGIQGSSDKKYLFIGSSSKNEDEIWYLRRDELDFTPKVFLKRTDDVIYDIDHKNNEFYIHINDKGKNYRLVKTSDQEFQNPNKWHEIIAHNDKEYLLGFDLSEDFLVVNRRINGINKITIFDNDLNSQDIKFPEESYTASGYYPTFDNNNLRVSYTSLTTPSSLYEYSFNEQTLKLLKSQEIPSGYDQNEYESQRIYAKADDQTEIPISIVYKKSLFTKDSSQPLYLYGYGSYGIAIPPSFRSSIISLLDRGFIFAIAHIRGGDDLGHEWYEQAKFLNKKLTFTDFISCAKYLIDNKYTNKDKLVISGGSAGGMLVTAAANMEPNLFKAVIADVPFVDVLNTMLDETLPLTPGEFKEWGNPKEQEYFDYIKSYSPYDNINKASYPAMFITAGISDPRVTYWEPAKYTAKMRELNKNYLPILFSTEMSTGHQGNSGRYDSLKDIAKKYSFAIALTK